MFTDIQNIRLKEIFIDNCFSDYTTTGIRIKYSNNYLFQNQFYVNFFFICFFVIVFVRLMFPIQYFKITLQIYQIIMMEDVHFLLNQ